MTAETITRPSLELPLMEAIEAAAAVLPHASRDVVTPVITHAWLSGDRLIATDRYTVGQFRLSASLDGGFLIPRQALDWLARISPKTLVGYYAGSDMGAYSVRITGPDPEASGPALADELVVIEVVYGGKPERMQKFKPYKGNFPPVSELLDKHCQAVEVVPVKLSPELVERVTGYARKWHRGWPVTFLAGKSDNPRKPGVVRLSIGKLDALIQPNLLEGP